MRWACKDTITEFSGEYSFLSNFFPSEISVWDTSFPTVEHAYQAAKVVSREDYLHIRNAATPGEAKRLARKCQSRKDWDLNKVQVMRTLLNKKFHQNPELGLRLTETGDIPIIEGNNWHDNFWGDCNCQECTSSPGQNCLGKILMDVRKDLQMTQK